MNSGKLRRAFLISSGAFLLIMGGGKIYLLFDSSRALNALDPVFDLPFRFLSVSVGILEVIVACFCYFGRGLRLGLSIVAWLATNLAVYRLLMLASGWKAPCPCLGSLTGKLPISTRTASTISGLVLAYLLVGSYALLVARHEQSVSKSS